MNTVRDSNPCYIQLQGMQGMPCIPVAPCGISMAQAWGC